MPTRHTGTLTALLLTAALFLAMPGLWESVRSQDTNRMAESLRPPRMRVMTVWLLPDGPDDRSFINELLSAFEKERRGVRIFLRRVTEDELYADEAVLPDAVLFSTGEIHRPEDVLLPLALEKPHVSGQSRTAAYAVPLWHRPLLLCYPDRWGDDPWPGLTRPGALELPSGTALQQLLFTCPETFRNAMVDAALGRMQPTATPAPNRDSVPRTRGQTPTPRPGGTARLAEAPREGECSLRLFPETADRVRYAALCRNNEDALAFLEFLMRADPSLAGLEAPPQTLPNAFSHTREEIDSLCLDGFSRLADPALTLLSLR